MPIVTVQQSPRDLALKRRLVERITEAFVEVYGLSPESVQIFDLLQPPHVALGTVEACAEERLDEVARDARADDFGAEAEDVHVVVLDALVRGVDVVADRGPDPRLLAGGDRRADA